MADLANATRTRDQLLVEIGQLRRRVQQLEAARDFPDLGEYLPEMIWRSGADKQRTYFNRAWLEFTGRPLEDQLGDGWTRAVHPEDRNRCLTTYISAFDCGETFTMEYRLRRHDGQHRWILESTRPWHRADGKIGGYVGSCIDIDRRMRAEQRLRESQERFESLLQSIDDVVWSADIAGPRMLYMNRAAQRVYGRPVQEFFDNPNLWFEVVHTEDRELVTDNATQLMERGQTACEYRIVRPDGTVRWILDRQHVIYTDRGEPVRIGGQATDITDRKRAEMENARFRAILETTTDFVGMADNQGRVLYVNRAGRNLVAIPDDEDITQTTISNYHSADANRLITDVGVPTAVRDGVWSGESVLVRRDGQTIAVSLVLIAHKDVRGEVEFLSAIMRDIRERKRAKKRLQRFFDISIDMMCIAGTDGTFKDISPAFEKVLGYTTDQLLTRPFVEFVHPDDREPTLAAVRQLTDGQNVIDFVNRYRRRDGSYCWLEWRSAAAQDEGLIYAIARDVTDRRRLIGELEEKNAELESFTYTISHDLKTPLITIKGFLGMLEQDVQAGATLAMRDDMAEIAKAADHMNRLLDELLELSRIGRVTNPPEEIDLNELVPAALGGVRPLLDQHRMAVSVEPDLPVVRGDRLRLLQVFQNLIENAVKFRGAADRPQIAVGKRRDGGQTVCFVKDDGVGIHPRYAHKVFDLFEKLDAGSEGTGVGLAIVKRIIEHHGGRVWVESDGPGKGTTICLAIPANN